MYLIFAQIIWIYLESQVVHLWICNRFGLCWSPSKSTDRTWVHNPASFYRGLAQNFCFVWM